MAGASAAAAGPRAYVLRADNTLLAIDIANPTAIGTPIPIVGLNAGDTLVGIDFRPQNGFLVRPRRQQRRGHRAALCDQPSHGPGHADRHDGHVRRGRRHDTVDKSSATSFGFDFIPTTDRIRVVTDAGQNFRINPNTGAFVDGDRAALRLRGRSEHGRAHRRRRHDGRCGGLYEQPAERDHHDALHAGLGDQHAATSRTRPTRHSDGPEDGHVERRDPIDFTSVTGFDILPGVNAAANNAVTGAWATPR